MIAQDIMENRFHTLHPAMTIREAVKAFRDAPREEGKKVFGMIVTDEQGCLVGMLSILYSVCQNYSHLKCFADSRTPFSNSGQAEHFVASAIHTRRVDAKGSAEKGPDRYPGQRGHASTGYFSGERC